MPHSDMDLSGVMIALAGVLMPTLVVWRVLTWPAVGWTLVLGGAVLNSDAASKPILASGETNTIAEDAIVSSSNRFAGINLFGSHFG